MYDVIFLSYNESNAYINWRILCEHHPFPSLLHNVHGVTGIIAAHKEAARVSKTEYFWVVDGDNAVSPSFEFDYRWPKTEITNNPVMVWQAVNSVNALTYGYGGVKLLPRKAVLDMSEPPVDFTTSISDYFYLNDRIASTTIFDMTPFEAWRAGFRECVKLKSRIIKDNNTEDDEMRLNVWTTVCGASKHGTYCVTGARQGKEYAMQCKDDVKLLGKINDFEWLRGKFHADASRI